MRTSITSFLLACTLAACDLDNSPDAHDSCATSGHLIETRDGDHEAEPAPRVCGATDGTFHYIDFDGACDAGMAHYCYVGEYMAAASLVVCCNQLGLECNQQAANCQPELWHVCDTPF